MWLTYKNGKPQLPIGDPLLVPYNFMWESEDVDITANDMDKKVRRGTDVINNQSFISKGIEKFLEFAGSRHKLIHMHR